MDDLTEDDVLQLMREVWDERLREALKPLNELGVEYKDGSGESHPAISKGLKLRHSKSGILYTVAALGTSDIILKSPEGEQFAVSHKEIEQDYDLD